MCHAPWRACYLVRAWPHQSCATQTLDLGFNRLGGGGLAHEALGALADFLKVNTSLHHLNLSNNNIKREHALILAQGMQDNRTLLGLHMTGARTAPCPGCSPRGASSFQAPASHSVVLSCHA